jgi:hypothetical protein
MLEFTNTLHSAGRNPRYHGNGIWTSSKKDSSEFIGWLVIIAIVISVYLVKSFLKRNKKA